MTKKEKKKKKLKYRNRGEKKIDGMVLYTRLSRFIIPLFFFFFLFHFICSFRKNKIDFFPF